jgi:hypothetical protein
MEKACEEVPAPSGQNAPRRGRYAQLSTGISYGGGSKVSTSPWHGFDDRADPVTQGPHEMKIYSKRDDRLLKGLENLRGVRRLVGFTDRELPSDPTAFRRFGDR